MLYKIKGKPAWYKVWAVSIALCAIYYLIKLFFFQPTSFDRLLEVYVFLSLLADYFINPKTNGA